MSWNSCSKLLQFSPSATEFSVVLVVVVVNRWERLVCYTVISALDPELEERISLVRCSQNLKYADPPE